MVLNQRVGNMNRNNGAPQSIWDEARAQTAFPFEMIHFNNAGSSLMPRVVLDTMVDYLNLEAKMGGYEAAEEKWDEIQKTYESAATLIGAKPSEIAFVENATKGWQMIYYGLHFKKGDFVLTTNSEYGSNYLAFLHLKEKFGIEIKTINDDEYGQISIPDLIKTIDDLNRDGKKIKLLSLTHIPSQGGLINPAEEVGKIVNEKGIFYLLDATQSIGQISVNVKEIGCDALCATGRKYLRGPRGTGFLYLNRKRFQEVSPLFIELKNAIWKSLDSYEIVGDAKRFETFEKSYSNILGLKAAIDYCLNLGIKNIEKKIFSLSKYLRSQLDEISSIELTDLGENQCGIVTFRINGSKNDRLSNYLKKNKVNFSLIPLRRTRNDFPRRNIDSIFRMSLHYFNNENEIDRLCKLLSDYETN
jgi:cysteine desulfurase / selenocysteine lyase